MTNPTSGKHSSAPSANINSLLISAMSNLTPSAITSTNGSSSGTTDESASNTTSDSSGLINAADLIICKLTSPAHIINDPRLLECGHSACLSCIVALGKQSAAATVKCVYCQQMHRMPTDPAKLISNKNLHTFLKLNFAQMNQNFSKQLEDSMFALEQKIQSQNLAMENFDQYLNLVQNDVQTKLDAMKNHLEKYGEQFIESLKLMRKQVQKYWNDHSARNNPFTTTPSNPPGSQNLVQSLNHIPQVQQSSQQQASLLSSAAIQLTNQPFQLSKEKTLQIIGLKNESLLPANLSVLTVLNANNTLNSSYHLNSFQNPTPSSSSSSSTSSSSSLTNSNLQQAGSNSTSTPSNPDLGVNKARNSSLINNSNKTTLLQHNDALNTSLDVLQTFNFSNSSSWQASEEDLDDFDTDISLKPVQTNSSSSSAVNGQKRHLNKEQAQFNKFVRDEVSKKFGDDFLLEHEVNQLESSIMELIKGEAIASFLPKDTTPARAWTLAKVSLRSLKRDLRRKQGLPAYKKDTSSSKLLNRSHF